MKILKDLGTGIIVTIGSLIAMGCVIGGVIFTLLFFGSGEKKIVAEELISSKEFKVVHNSIYSLNGIVNIAVLPQQNYIVIEGIVINLTNRTFGKEPELGFYNNYYDEGDSISFTTIDSLFASKDILIDSIKLMRIVEEMKRTEISDIIKKDEDIYYRWNVSAMYGEEGVLYSKRTLTKDSTRYDVFEKVDDNFYHFARE